MKQELLKSLEAYFKCRLEREYSHYESDDDVDEMDEIDEILSIDRSTAEGREEFIEEALGYLSQFEEM